MDNNNVIGVYPVVSLDDDLGGGRIKVRMDVDNNYSLSEIPYAFPLLPKVFHSFPKIGESVLILKSNVGDNMGQRYYIGPVISQLQKLEFDSDLLSSKNLLNGALGVPLPNIDMDSSADGAFPEKSDVAIVGRRKTDIIQKDNETHIRCGCRIPNSTYGKGYQFNLKDPSFIQLIHYDKPKTYKNNRNGKLVTYKSVTNVVGDKINLISHGSHVNFDTNKNKNLIDEETLKKIFEDAHQLPYGDKLVDFLKLFISAFKTHTHAYSGLPPVPDDAIIAVDKYNMESILSESIRIN